MRGAIDQRATTYHRLRDQSANTKASGRDLRLVQVDRRHGAIAIRESLPNSNVSLKLDGFLQFMLIVNSPFASHGMSFFKVKCCGRAKFRSEESRHFVLSVSFERVPNSGCVVARSRDDHGGV